MMHKVEIEEQDVTEIFSPYTGKCVVDKDGEINENDDSLLFVYAGFPSLLFCFRAIVYSTLPLSTTNLEYPILNIDIKKIKHLTNLFI